MTTILLAGTGAVGVRTARQLLETAGVDQLLVTDRRPERATELAAAQQLLADATLRWDSGRSVLLDVGVTANQQTGARAAMSDVWRRSSRGAVAALK